MLTVIIDYESGNLHSAEKAFQRCHTSRESAIAGQHQTVGAGDDLGV